jgi:hypothetical protein
VTVEELSQQVQRLADGLKKAEAAIQRIEQDGEGSSERLKKLEAAVKELQRDGTYRLATRSR